MKNSTRMNLVIIALINWGIALFINETYNYVSAAILAIAFIYLLINIKDIPTGKWEPINFGKLFK